MIIKSILDTDLYKLSMQQAVIAFFPGEIVRYELIIRTKRDFPADFAEALGAEIARMRDLAIRPHEIDFLKKTCYFLKPPYIDFLRGFCFNPDEVVVVQHGQTVSLTVEGHWYRTILWEVPLMAMISELYFRLADAQPLPASECHSRIRRKAEQLEAIGAHFADFGTRRRFSFENHDRVVDACMHFAPAAFVGTSNLYLASKHQCKAIGTQAHEWYMSIAALYGYTMANRIGMEKWVEMYQGDLGIALTDTFTSEVFWGAFDSKFAKLFDGIRQDSGDPIAFAERAIRHYEKLHIDPMSKTIVFSDTLDVNAVERIHGFCRRKIKDSYGIGTNLTNDVGVTPLNMVIKLTAVKINDSWVPAVKLSDDVEKHTGADEAVNLCKRILRIAK